MLSMHKLGICLRCVAAVCLLASLEGCRSTRNSLSGIPGMGWMASKEPNVSDWETDGAIPTKPTTEATPLVASRTSKPKSETSKTDVKSARGDSSDLADRSERGSTGEKDARSSTKSGARVAAADASGREKYDTGRYDTGKSGSGTGSGKGESGRGGAVATAPKRGFYGSEYNDAGETAAEASGGKPKMASRASSDSAADSGDVAEADDARGYSRFSQRVTPTAGETPGRFGSHEDGVPDQTYADSAREFAAEATGTVEEARDELKNQFKQGVRAAAAVPRELAESTEDTAREAYQKAGRQAVAVQGELEKDLESATNAVKEEVSETRKELSKVGRHAAEAADEAITQTARAADEAVTSGAKSAEAAAGRAYSRFRNRFVDTDESADATAPGESAPKTDSGEGKASEDSKAAEPSALPVKRSTQPWRPGGTGDYSSNKVSQAEEKRPSNDTSTVEQAAYQDASRSRLSPTYR